MANLKKSSGNASFDEVVQQIEDENARDLGDVLTSEDGYVHDEPLLAGYLDPETGIRHKTFTYREMTGKDEEAINKAEVKSNGAKLINVLLERCVTEIGTLTKKDLGTRKWGEVIRNLYGGDLDYMALKVREISKGKEVVFEHVCPNCKTKLKTYVGTDEFGITPFAGNDEVPFTLPRGYRDGKGEIHKEGTIRMLNGYDREIVIPMFKKNVATATTMMITRLVKFDDGTPVINEYVSNMSLRDREYLEEIIKDNTFGLDMNVEIICTNCGSDISGDVGTSNFF